MKIRSAGQLLVAAALTAGALTGVSPAGAAPPRAEAVAKRVPTCAPMDHGAITRLYKAYFLRDPDADGIAYWSIVLRSRQADLAGVSQYFSTSAEFRSRYSNLTNRQFVNLVYTNVMNRPPDQAGLDYWTSLLDTRRLTRGLVMLSFSESPEFKERVNLWPAPSAAGDPRLLPQSVPNTLNPKRIAERAGTRNGVVELVYEYPGSVTLDEIFAHSFWQLTCPDWDVLEYDTYTGDGNMLMVVQGGNGLTIELGVREDGGGGRVAWTAVSYE